MNDVGITFAIWFKFFGTLTINYSSGTWQTRNSSILWNDNVSIAGCRTIGPPGKNMYIAESECKTCL